MSNIREPQSPIHPHEHKLVRSLGLLDVVMIGIAGMVGGSIFVLTGPAIGLAGSSVILAFILNAIITLFTAMSYAELGSAMPEAGGGYLWVREGLRRPNAFISGWMAWLAHIIAGSLYAVGFGSFFISLLQMTNILTIDNLFGIIPLDKLTAVIVVAVFTFINIKGTSETGRVGTIITAVQIVAIISIIIAGLWSMSSHPTNWQSNFADFLPMGFAGLVAAMGLTFIAFEGYEIIVQTGEEIKNPKRNIPRAIFISLALVVIMYCLIAFVSIGAIFPDESSWQFIGIHGDLGIMKAVELFLPYGAFIVLAGGLVSTLAALNATTFSSARVAFAMGRHYNLPHILSAIHPKFKTPYVSVILSCIIMGVMAYSLPLEDIAHASGVIFLLLFTQVNLAVISIRRMYGDKLDYGYKIPFFPYVPIIGIILMIGLALYLLITAPLSWAITVLWVLIGFTIYRIFTFKKEIEHYSPTLTSEGNLKRKDFRILLPYTPENPDRLIRYAIQIAKEKDGEINILRTITVPHQTPLSAGVAFIESARKTFDSLEELLNKEDVVWHYFVRISHDATEAVLTTIAEQKISLMVIDYETVRSNKKLQTLVTCDVLAIIPHSEDFIVMERQNNADKIRLTTKENKKNVVVLYDNGDNSDEILRVTTWFTNTERFNLNVIAINRKGSNNYDDNDDEDDNETNNNHKGKKSINDNDTSTFIKRREFFQEAGVELNEIHVPKDVEQDSTQFAKLILESIMRYNPDVIITESYIGKYNLFTSTKFASLLLSQLNYPIIIVRDYAIPLVSIIKYIMMKITGNLGPTYLVKLMRNRIK
ncbi:MAG TPA: amino acid permease [Nitrososphaeraceae archaeon]|nr:amino acid permease [Nitrososphaeraceae archaeon]